MFCRKRFSPKATATSKDLTEKIAAVCRELKVPVVVKEVGNGISVDVGQALASRRRRRHRRRRQRRHRLVRRRSAARHAARQAATVRTLPTGGFPPRKRWSACARRLPDIQLVASGGIRSGLDIAKSIALGADLGGFRPAACWRRLWSRPAKVVEFIGGIIHELKVAMLCAGAANLAALRRLPWCVSADVCDRRFGLRNPTLLIATTPMAEDLKQQILDYLKKPQHHDAGDLRW